MKEKVVLAYSGGLDTTAIIPWLKENFDYEVICVCVNCGQEEELDGLEERAKFCGAEKLYIDGKTRYRQKTRRNSPKRRRQCHLSWRNRKRQRSNPL